MCPSRPHIGRCTRGDGSLVVLQDLPDNPSRPSPYQSSFQRSLSTKGTPKKPWRWFLFLPPCCSLIPTPLNPPLCPLDSPHSAQVVHCSGSPAITSSFSLSSSASPLATRDSSSRSTLPARRERPPGSVRGSLLERSEGPGVPELDRTSTGRGGPGLTRPRGDQVVKRGRKACVLETASGRSSDVEVDFYRVTVP